jgi:hypothetical protein
MWRRLKRHDGRYERLRRHWFKSDWAGVLLAAGAITMTACGTDHPTSLSALTVPGSPTGSTLGKPSLPRSRGTSQTANTVGSAHATTAPGTPGHFRLENRNGSQLRLNWDWGSGVIRYELSYADRTVLLNQYYPGHIQDVSDVDLSPGHTYTLSLQAFDEAGNASGPAELLFDTTPPQPPNNLQQLSTRRITYNDGRFADYPDLISFNPATDNAGPIRAYEALLDGVSFGRITGGQTTQFSLFQLVSEAYISMPCGPTTLHVRAYDTSLNADPLGAPLTVMFPVYENCPPPHRDR